MVNRLAEKLRNEVIARKQETGLSDRRLEAHLGLDDWTLKGLLQKAWTVPSMDNAQRIADALGWELYLGPPRPPQAGRNGSHQDYSDIVRYDVSAAAGNGAITAHPEKLAPMSFRNDWLTRMGLVPDKCCIVTARGDSMEPTLHSGDALLLDMRAAKNPIRNRHIYAFAEGEQVRVKRFDMRDNHLILVSDNPHHEAELLTMDEAIALNMIGRVVWAGHILPREM